MLSKPLIHQTTTIATSNLFTIESVDLEFSNGNKRTYERLLCSKQETVMITPILNNSYLILVREYAVGVEDYVLSFPKGLVNIGEQLIDAANRELMEEIGFGANYLLLLHSLNMAPSYFCSTTNIILAEQLYKKTLKGDEPEDLQIIYWPLDRMLYLLDKSDFCEARNVSALLILYTWLNNKNKNY